MLLNFQDDIKNFRQEKKMVTLNNPNMTVNISEVGAEMQNLIFNGNEYLWQGWKAIWAGRAPLMFPICGGLKDDKFIYDGKEYTLQKHGYARFTTFEVENTSDTEVTFLHTSNAETLVSYPFTYELRVTYALTENGICVTYKVKNTDSKTMYFSIGSHEAYATPEGIEDYDVIFPQNETLRATILDGNLLEKNSIPIITDCTTLPLYDKYFLIDALVFKDLKSKSATLRNRKTGRSVHVEFPNKPYFLLWHKHGAPYICLEPWAGIQDPQETDYDITKKEGIIALDAGNTYEVSHKITLGE